MSSESSYKGPFECDDEEDVDKLDAEEDSSSSANSDEDDEHTEFFESSDTDSMDVDSQASSSLTNQLAFPAPLPVSMIPFAFISRKI